MSLAVQEPLNRLQAALGEYRSAWNKADALQVLHQAAVAYLEAGGDSFCMLGKRSRNYTNVQVSLMSVAARHGWVDVMQRVIEGYRASNRSIDSPNSNNKTPLMVALRHQESLQTVKLLVEAGADVNKRAGEGLSPWQEAIHKGDLGIIKEMHEAGGDLRERIDGELCFLNAIGAGPVCILDYVLKHGIHIEEIGSVGRVNALHCAADKGNEPVIDQLLALGVPVDGVDGSGWTPLMHAINSRKLNAANKLLKAGASRSVVSVGGNTPLHLAAVNGVLELVNPLLEDPSTDINTGPAGKTPFFSALEHNREEVAMELHRRGADIVKSPCEDRSTLYVAALRGYGQLLKAIMQKGVDIEAKALGGTTALDFATRYEYLGVVEILLEGHANVNCVDSEKFAPIHTAARLANLELVKLLHRYGANLNLQTKEGYTPLHCAVRHMNAGNQNRAVELLRYLLENGAHLTIADREGRTPDKYLRAADFPAVAELLKTWGK